MTAPLDPREEARLRAEAAKRRLGPNDDWPRGTRVMLVRERWKPYAAQVGRIGVLCRFVARFERTSRSFSVEVAFDGDSDRDFEVVFVADLALVPEGL